MAENQGAVYEYLHKLYGGLLRPIESVVSIATTRTVVVGNNPDRVQLVFVNLGANAIFVFMTHQNFASGQGVRLAPSGGQMAVDITRDSILPAMNWFGRAEVGATDMFVLQVVREVNP